MPRSARRVAVAILAPLTLAALSPAIARAQNQPIPIGPYGGSANVVHAHPTTSGELLVARFPNGLQRSTDGGFTFAPWGSGLSGIPEDLVASPIAPTTLYAPVGSTIHRSTDFGANWAPWSSAASATVNGLAFSPDAQTVLQWTGSQVLRSTNGGGTWNPVYSGTLIGNVSIAPSAPSLCYLSSFNGVARSLDGGATFSIPATGLQSWTKWVLADPQEPLRVYAGTTSGVWLSTNGAQGFTKLTAAPNLSVQFMTWEGAPSSGTLWVGALTGLWRSSDFGSTWSASNAGLPPGLPIPSDLAFDANGTRLLASEGGFFRSPIGVPLWSQSAFAEVGVYAAAIAAPGGQRLIGAEKGVYDAASGATLEASGFFFDFGARTDELLVDPSNPERWLSAGVGAFLDNAVVRVLTNGGASVSLAYEHFGGGSVWTLARDPFDPSRYLGGVYPAGFGSAGLISSSNSGASFQDVAGTAGWSCRAVAFDPHQPGHAIALFGNNQWADTTTGGASWTLHNAWPGTAQAVTFAFDPWLSGVYYRADTGTGWSRSDDFGGSWVPLTATAALRSRIVTSNEAPGLLWLSDGGGAVLRSANRGASFETLFSAPAGGPCTALALDRASGALVIGTSSGSAWEQPGASPYVWLGSGKAGTGGFVPRHFGSNGLPELGNNVFRFSADRLVGGSTAWLYVGLTDLALPLFGGIVHTGPPQVLFAARATGGSAGVGGSGAIAVLTPIPNDGSIVGLQVFSQVFGLDTGATESISLSQGLRTTLQP
jgi:hypothetical protein